MAAHESATPLRALQSLPVGWLNGGLAAALALAGLIHLALTPDHMAESTLFGLGFLAAGAMQLGLATLAVTRPTRLLHATVITVMVVLIGLYVANVAIGLPLHATAHATHAPAVDESRDHEASADASEQGGAHADAAAHGEHVRGIEPHRNEATHASGGILRGAGEPVDGFGVVTQLVQLAGIGLAVLLLRRAPADRPRWTA